MNFSFERQINAANQDEAVKLCQKQQAQNGRGLVDVSKNSEWFERGVDLIEETPQRQILIDVKCDERIAETGNIAFELIEICSYRGFVKRGWAYSEINYIFYVDWHKKINYIFHLATLRYDVFKKSRIGFAAYHPKESYFTLGVLVPLSELRYKATNLLE